MKQYGVIHRSSDWTFGPRTARFKTEKEAYDYIKNYQTDRAGHLRDWAEVVEYKDSYEMVEVDKTDKGSIYGFKKEENKGDV